MFDGRLEGRAATPDEFSAGVLLPFEGGATCESSPPLSPADGHDQPGMPCAPVGAALICVLTGLEGLAEPGPPRVRLLWGPGEGTPDAAGALLLGICTMGVTLGFDGTPGTSTELLGGATCDERGGAATGLFVDTGTGTRTELLGGATCDERGGAATGLLVDTGTGTETAVLLGVYAGGEGAAGALPLSW
jgi:hypothetical protein